MACEIKDETPWSKTRTADAPNGTGLEEEGIKTDIIVSGLDTGGIVPQSLDNLLGDIKKVDLSAYLSTHNKTEPKQKDFIVAIIELVLEQARESRWDLAKQDDFVYFFNGKFWEQITRDALKSFLSKAAIKMGFNRIEARGHLFIDNLYKQFQASATFEAPPKSDAVLINLQNGTLEINGVARLRPHRKEDFLTYSLPFSYSEGATAPKFQRYLDEVLPCPDTQKVLQEFCGYIFTKDLKLEKCLVLYGTGANGKSVFLEMLNHLLGVDNISNYSLATLKEEHNRAMIKDVLVNWGSEIHGSLASDIFKNLASGEPIQARLKYGQSFLMRDYAKLAFNANVLPKETEQTEGFYRRFLIVPFEVTIPEERRDADLPKKIIKDELPGVLNWVLVGLQRLVAQRNFSHSDKVKQATETYKSESNTVALFIEEEGYKPSLEYRIATKALYSGYKEFCSDGGYRAVSVNTFSQRLHVMGYESIKSGSFRGFYIEKA